MSSSQVSALDGLRWLLRDPASGAIELRSAAGDSVAFTPEPGNEHVLAAAGEPCEVLTVRGRLADGSTATLEVRRVPGVAGLHVAVDAGSDERRVAAIIETLVNQIAHDVRNYAFTIGLQAELGDRRGEAQPDLKAHFTSVLRQVDALKAYLERLLLYGRPATLHPTIVDVGAFVRQQVQKAQFAWKPDAEPLSIGVEVAADVGQARWDTRCISEALLALLDNAARSAQPPPPVVVKVMRDAAMVTIEVADCGAGIPAEKIEQVWAPMRMRRHGGCGLGLPLARKMAVAHGGSISLESGPTGTTVRLRLPAEATAG